MTALTEYDRLESQGLWRPSPGAQRRDVVVSVGEATLILLDGNEVALAHWSLPAVERLNPGETPALYAPGPDTPEELEIADPDMIDAIERVRRAIERQRPHEGRLRGGMVAGLLILALAAATLWLPGALIRHTAAIAPEASRSAIGRDLMGALRPLTGPACDTPGGTRALARLHTRLLGPGPGKIAVMPGGIATSASIPGGTILVGRSLVEDYEAPDALAGFVLAETASGEGTNPLETMLRETGVVPALRLLTSGALPDVALRAYAETLVAGRDTTAPEADTLLPRFAEAGVPSSPYAYALDVTGETTVALIEADPVAPGTGHLILSDADWVALQGICGE